MPSHQAELLKAARAVARYQRTIRELRRRIKDAQKNLRVEQRHLRALAQLATEPDAVPMRLFGGDAGMKPAPCADCGQPWNTHGRGGECAAKAVGQS